MKDEIFNFVSLHEAIISHQLSDRDIDVRFTSFGNRAACGAISDVMSVLDKETQEKVIEMMKNKRIE